MLDVPGCCLPAHVCSTPKTGFTRVWSSPQSARRRRRLRCRKPRNLQKIWQFYHFRKKSKNLKRKMQKYQKCCRSKARVFRLMRSLKSLLISRNMLATASLTSAMTWTFPLLRWVLRKKQPAGQAAPKISRQWKSILKPTPSQMGRSSKMYKRVKSRKNS